MEVTLKIPSVSVPVLSKTTVSVLAKASIKFEPLIRIPSLLAPPIPAKKVRGMLITKAQGQLITRKVRERYSQTVHWGSFLKMICSRGGHRKRARAPQHTIGV